MRGNRENYQLSSEISSKTERSEERPKDTISRLETKEWEIWRWEKLGTGDETDGEEKKEEAGGGGRSGDGRLEVGDPGDGRLEAPLEVGTGDETDGEEKEEEAGEGGRSGDGRLEVGDPGDGRLEVGDLVMGGAAGGGKRTGKTKERLEAGRCGARGRCSADGRLEERPRQEDDGRRKEEKARAARIFVHLQKLMGRSKPTSVEGLSLTILRSRREDSHDVDIDTMVEHHSKLWVALNVLHECFQPFIEPRTKADFFANVVFNRGVRYALEGSFNMVIERKIFSKKKTKMMTVSLNRKGLGFYTMILEKEEEVISVATVRIFGEKVAEVPLIGTRVQYRRLGMCRILMNEIEKVVNAFLLGFRESFFEEKQTMAHLVGSNGKSFCAGSLLLSGCAPLYCPPHIEHGQDKKRTTLGLKSYLTRAAARRRVAKTAS
ncbi:hypothetical protein ACLOJK_031689 [Asimina triloba]